MPKLDFIPEGHPEASNQSVVASGRRDFIPGPKPEVKAEVPAAAPEAAAADGEVKAANPQPKGGEDEVEAAATESAPATPAAVEVEPTKRKAKK